MKKINTCLLLIMMLLTSFASCNKYAPTVKNKDGLVIWFASGVESEYTKVEENEWGTKTTPLPMVLPELRKYEISIQDGFLYVNDKAVLSDGGLMGYGIMAAYFIDLNGDGYREVVCNCHEGSGIVDIYIQVYDIKNDKTYEKRDRMVTNYFLKVEDDTLKVVTGINAEGILAIENGMLVIK